jgi:hypothetical protein
MFFNTEYTWCFNAHMSLVGSAKTCSQYTIELSVKCKENTAPEPSLQMQNNFYCETIKIQMSHYINGKPSLKSKE